MNKRQHPTGNGNVFKDLGIPNAEEHLLKAQLTKEALTARAAELGWAAIGCSLVNEFFVE
jgi:hypothetical protein